MSTLADRIYQTLYDPYDIEPSHFFRRAETAKIDDFLATIRLESVTVADLAASYAADAADDAICDALGCDYPTYALTFYGMRLEAIESYLDLLFPLSDNHSLAHLIYTDLH